MRYELLRRAVAEGEQDQEIRVTLPNGDTRSMSPEPSSVIRTAVIEEFARRFLDRPASIWLSESKQQVVAQDQLLARNCRLNIDTTRTLPDMILVDLELADPRIVFVEVVASARPVHVERRQALLEIATSGGHDPAHVAFVTVFLDHTRPEHRNDAPALAMGSFAWFASEPDHIIHLRSPEGGTVTLSRLLAI